MGFVVAMATLLSGTAKCVSVCGINSAAKVQPGLSRNARRRSFAGYLGGLLVGALALVIGAWIVGRVIADVIAIPEPVRLAMATLALVVIGILEVAHGPWLLPHIAWAVPRTWSELPVIGLPLFGLIRGIAVFNHSPFASFHAWLIVVILLPDALPVGLIAVLLAGALATHSMVYTAFALRDRASAWIAFDRWSARVMNSGVFAARLDGAFLIVFGIVGAVAR